MQRLLGFVCPCLPGGTKLYLRLEHINVECILPMNSHPELINAQKYQNVLAVLLWVDPSLWINLGGRPVLEDTLLENPICFRGEKMIWLCCF